MQAIHDHVISMLSSFISLVLVVIVLLVAFGFMLGPLFGQRNGGLWILGLLFNPVKNCLGSVGKGMLGCLGILFFASIGINWLLGGLKQTSNPPPPTPDLRVSLSITPPSNAMVGTTVTLTANTVSGESANYTFQVIDSRGQKQHVQTNGASALWIPSFCDTYEIKAFASTTNYRGEDTAVSYAVTEQPFFRYPTSPYDPPAPGRRGGYGSNWFTDDHGNVKIHNGVDVCVGRKDRPEVRAIAHGTIRLAKGFGPGWGEVVVAEHALNGEQFVAVYGHIDIDSSIVAAMRDSEVVEVEQGQVIGWVDETMYGPEDLQTGRRISVPHLHFGLFRGTYREFPSDGWGAMPKTEFPGKWVDPNKYLR